MKFRWQLVFLCLAASCLAAQAQKAATPPPAPDVTLAPSHTPNIPPARPVARVNGTLLTDLDLLREMYTIFPYAKQHNGNFPKAMEANIRQGALKMIEFEELVYQEAKRRQMKISPARLATAEQQLRQRFPNEEYFQHFLQVEAGGSKQVLRTKIERSLLIEDLLQQQVEDKSSISTAEAKAFYQQNLQRFQLPETYALQTITVMPPKAPAANPAKPAPVTTEQDKQMRARAEAALKQAKATKSYEEFGVLAEKISEDDYRVMMGDHRAMKVADIPVPILAVVTKLQPGQVSDLIAAEGAYTIVRLNAHTPARTATFEQAQEELRTQLQRSKREKLRRDLDARLRKDAKIEEL